MKLTIERLPESRVQLEITAEEAETAAAMDRAARKVGNQVTLPGFRKGKAPRAMIERVYGPDVFTEEANRYLLSDLYRQAIEIDPNDEGVLLRYAYFELNAGNEAAATWAIRRLRELLPPWKPGAFRVTELEGHLRHLRAESRQQASDMTPDSPAL